LQDVNDRRFGKELERRGNIELCIFFLLLKPKMMYQIKVINETKYIGLIEFHLLYFNLDFYSVIIVLCCA
jgi:hypothetical protein